MIATFTGFFVAPEGWAVLSLIAFLVLCVVGAVALYRGKDDVFEEDADEGAEEDVVYGQAMGQHVDGISYRGLLVMDGVELGTGRLVNPDEMC